MRYYKFYCSNGYCGYDEEFYEEVEDDCDIEEYAEDILFNRYGFTEPDGRIIDGKSWGDEITVEEYQDNLTVDYEEISKEEYEENC